MAASVFAPRRRCHHVAAARAALAFGEPAVARSRRVGDRSRMRDTKARQLGEEQLRILDPFHNARCIAEQWPALCDLSEEWGAILEAGATDSAAERRRGRFLGERFKRRPESLPLKPALQIVELAAGMSDLARIVIGEEIGHERHIARPPRGGRERPAGHRYNQKRSPVRRRAFGQGRRRRGSRDKAASPTRSSCRTVRPRCGT